MNEEQTIDAGGEGIAQGGSGRGDGKRGKVVIGVGWGGEGNRVASHVVQCGKRGDGWFDEDVRLGRVVEGCRWFGRVIGEPDGVVEFDVERVSQGVEFGSVGVVEESEVAGVNGLAGHEASRNGGQLAGGVFDGGGVGFVAWDHVVGIVTVGFGDAEWASSGVAELADSVFLGITLNGNTSEH